MRARVKNYDDMPEWMRCCAAGEAGQRPMDGMLLEVDPAVRGVSSSTCGGCGKRTEGLLWIRARTGAGTNGAGRWPRGSTWRRGHEGQGE